MKESKSSFENDRYCRFEGLIDGNYLKGLFHYRFDEKAPYNSYGVFIPYPNYVNEKIKGKSIVEVKKRRPLKNFLQHILIRSSTFWERNLHLSQCWLGIGGLAVKR
ncbi:hypothetical protein J7K18_01600 [bacterium]|nr:hypothetical protein [bacterium]